MRDDFLLNLLDTMKDISIQKGIVDYLINLDVSESEIGFYFGSDFGDYLWSKDLLNARNKYKRIRIDNTLNISNISGIELAKKKKHQLPQFRRYDSIQSMSKDLSETVISARAKKPVSLSKIDFTPVFVNEFINSGSLKESIETAYEIAQEEINEKEVTENTLESDFSSIEELEEVVNEHISNPKGFQERIANWSQEKKIKYFIIWQLICFLWMNFCQPYFQANIGMPAMSYIVSNVKELPEKGAKVICQLKQNVEAIILENTSYYYKVSFIDEDGNVREGYVAKKNLKVLNEDENVEKEKEEKVSDGQE